MKRTDPLKLAKSYTEKLDALDIERAQLVESRNRAIIKAHDAGASVIQIGRATGLTRTMVYKILGK